MGEITDYTKNDACSNCGQCCGDILLLSADDIQRLKKYVSANNIKPLERRFPLPGGTVDLGCPFRDDTRGICAVYPARPWICRAFRCDQSRDEIERRKKMAKGTMTYSLRYILYGDERNQVLLEITRGGNP